ncbi:hypothetical protein IKZ77_02980, partial [Candidatus Saccharibacteria bacterium]|nr:hypothetical protein [Candidatus Saccharibacteria bacterium]
TSGDLFVVENYEFYKILEYSTDLRVINSLSDIESDVSFLGKPNELPEGYKLSRIFTSPMRNDSDIIYLYTAIEKEGE